VSTNDSGVNSADNGVTCATFTVNSHLSQRTQNYPSYSALTVKLSRSFPPFDKDPTDTDL
jgi:hypothetical protein